MENPRVCVDPAIIGLRLDIMAHVGALRVFTENRIVVSGSGSGQGQQRLPLYPASEQAFTD